MEGPPQGHGRGRIWAPTIMTVKVEFVPLNTVRTALCSLT